MRFYHVIKRKKLLFISIFLLLYVLINFFDGNRGFFSYIEKTKIKNSLIANKEKLKKELNEMDNKNSLLSEKTDLDFIDTLVRDKLSFGKKNEILIKINE